jgi:hypothetical protein
LISKSNFPIFSLLFPGGREFGLWRPVLWDYVRPQPITPIGVTALGLRNRDSSAGWRDEAETAFAKLGPFGPPIGNDRDRGSSPCLRVDDFVIAAAKELDQTEAVAERVGQDGDVAPNLDLGFALELGAGSKSARQGGLDIIDDQIEMHGGPVTRVAARFIPSADRAFRFFEQVEPNRQAGELSGPGAQAARDDQSKRPSIESDGFGQIGDVDVDQ